MILHHPDLLHHPRWVAVVRFAVYFVVVVEERKRVMKSTKKKSRAPPVRAEAVLRKLYYDINNSVSYSNPARLLSAAKEINPRITKKQVNDWLSMQDTYTLHRTSKLIFPRRKVIVRGIQHQYQADLMDMQNLSSQNSGTRYLLNVVDCFSRKAVSVCLNKKTGPVVAEALRRAFDVLGWPRKLQTDQGTEFINDFVARLTQSKGVRHFSSDQELKASLVERFNRTLREKINKYMTHHQTPRYVDVLSKLVKNYNNSPHRGLLGMTPLSVTKANEGTVFRHQYGDYLKQKAWKPKFKIGDVVRVALIRRGFVKRTKNFQKDLYQVVDVLSGTPPMYRLKTLKDNRLVKGSYYGPQLIRVRVISDIVKARAADVSTLPIVPGKYYTSLPAKKKKKRKATLRSR